MNINKFGRSYISGKPIQDDYRRIIIEKLLAEGGDRSTGYIPVCKSQLKAYVYRYLLSIIFWKDSATSTWKLPIQLEVIGITH